MDNTTDDVKILIKRKDFMQALNKVFPSVSKKDELAYSKLQTSLRKSRGHIEEEDQKNDVKPNKDINNNVSKPNNTAKNHVN